MDGFYIINKPKGITSFGVCNKIKHITGEKHVGHTGTLDPDTTGVLVVGVGKACKLMSLLNEHDKEYETIILLGKSSDTLDISGTIIDDYKTNISNDDIFNAVDALSKKEEQIPPMYSAIKVNGKKMYELAREGKNIELKERNVKVYYYKIKKICNIDGYQAIDIIIKVSKGFYVRSFARDLGKILGVPSLMYELVRTSAGDFDIRNSIKLEDININDIISIDSMFDFEKLYANDFIAKLAKNGVTFDERQIITDKPFKIYNNNELIAIYEPVGNNKYKPIVIL